MSQENLGARKWKGWSREGGVLRNGNGGRRVGASRVGKRRNSDKPSNGVGRGVSAS